MKFVEKKLSSKKEKKTEKEKKDAMTKMKPERKNT